MPNHEKQKVRIDRFTPRVFDCHLLRHVYRVLKQAFQKSLHHCEIVVKPRIVEVQYTGNSFDLNAFQSLYAQKLIACFYTYSVFDVVAGVTKVRQ